MHEIRPYIKSNLYKSIPEHIRDQYPGIVNLLRAYYDFLETSNESNYYLNRIDHIRDIDLTFDKFLPEVKKEYSLSTPSYHPTINQRNTLKRIKEFFISRGSSESIDSFFKLFFDDQAELEYPREKMLIPSDGIFDKSLVGQLSEIFNETNLNSTEIYKERYFIRNVGEAIYIYLNDALLEKETEYTLKYVNSSDSSAKDKRYEINPPYDQSTGNSFGKRYNIPFDSRDPSHSELLLILEDGSSSTLSAGIDYEIGDIVLSTDPDPYTNLGLPTDMTKRSLYFYNVLPAYCTIRIEYASSIKERIILNSNLSVNPTGNTFTAYKEATGYGSNNKGFLSDDIYIQDSYFYQIFSYIIKTGIDPSIWSNGFNRLIHPAGFLYFIQLILNIYILKTDFDEEDVWIPAIQPGRQFGGGLIIYIPLLFPLGSEEYEENRIRAGGNFAGSLEPIEKYIPFEINTAIGDQIRYYDELNFGVYNDLDHQLGPINHFDDIKFLYPDPIRDFGDFTIQQGIDEEVPFNIGSFSYSMTNYIESTVNPSTTADQILTNNPHGFSTGDSLYFDTSFGNITEGIVYWARVIDTDEFSVYSSEAYANSGGSTGLISISVGEGSGKIYPNDPGNIIART